MRARGGDGGGAARAAYQRVRARLEALTIELDDAERTSALLVEALAKERQDARQALEDATVSHRHSAAEAAEEHQAKLREMLSRADDYLATKAELTTEVKRAASAVRQQQTSTQQAVAAATEAAQQELQGARSAWQSGEAGRRVKFLARKAEEAKAVTLEGLAPEIEALKAKHQRMLEEQASTANSAHEQSLASAREAHETACAEIRAEAARVAGEKLDKEAQALRQRLDQLRRQQSERLRQLLAEQVQPRTDDACLDVLFV